MVPVSRIRSRRCVAHEYMVSSSNALSTGHRSQLPPAQVNPLRHGALCRWFRWLGPPEQQQATFNKNDGREHRYCCPLGRGKIRSPPLPHRPDVAAGAGKGLLMPDDATATMPVPPLPSAPGRESEAPPSSPPFGIVVASCRLRRPGRYLPATGRQGRRPCQPTMPSPVL